MIKRSAEFVLPFEISSDGLPDIKWLRKTSYRYFGAVMELDDAFLEQISAIFKQWPGDTNTLYVYADSSFSSFGKFTVGKESISFHCNNYSIYHLVFSDPSAKNHFFVSEDGRRIAFIGREEFVAQARLLLPGDLIRLAADTADDFFEDEDSRRGALRFVAEFSAPS